MTQGHLLAPLLALTVLASSLCCAVAQSDRPARPPGSKDGGGNNPLNIGWGPAPDPQDGPPFSAGALRNPAYLPAQIGGIIAAYGVSLVLVAVTLLSLAKRRRQRLLAGNNELAIDGPTALYSPEYPPAGFHSFPDANPDDARSRNFSYPSPVRTDFKAPSPCVQPSATPAVKDPETDPFVGQGCARGDGKMTQQLDDVYKHDLGHDAALDTPTILQPSQQRASASASTGLRKDKTKPASLHLSGAREQKTQSKAASFLSALRSPRKKNLKGVSISSPIMTPQSSTFARQDTQELNAMTPRLYAPPPMPAMPAGQASSGASRTGRSGAPLSPDMSPQSVQSIDERISAQLGPPPPGNSRHGSRAPTEVDPESATSEHSQVPLIGLPSSPRPRAKSPPLPSSPKTSAGLGRPNAPPAVRTGGSLPLRAYEPAMNSPSATAHATKQTVFERRGPLSPTTGRTPCTAGAVPYSPYQPFTPCIPMTPSLVTKEDRKRMKRLVPKTPTLEMVRSSDELW